jgi:sterol desaturase/sphingolipid hydroxylase (fatty acid hydroxylase superfamily)
MLFHPGIEVPAVRLRPRLRSSKPLRYYDGRAHFALNFAMCAGGIAWCVSRLQSVMPLELLAIPATLLYANVVEYFIHREVMHKRRPGLGILYESHHREHHRFFTARNMGAESHKDYAFILYPPILGIIVFLGGLGTPPVLVASWIATPNAALLAGASIISYFLNYELLEFCYHSSVSSPLRRLPLVSRLARHHRDHHRRPTTRNFNVTYPLVDWIAGTLDRESPR